MKVYTLAPREDWIVDRLVAEWNDDNCDIAVKNPEDASIIWLFADWCHDHINTQLLRSKRVVTTIHHIVPEKFGKRQLDEFRAKESFTTAFHVPNEHTLNYVQCMTNRPVHVIPYWANQRIWRCTDSKNVLRSKYGIGTSNYVVGSFVRDTEGSDLVSPKLEKGPDLFIEYVAKLHSTWKSSSERWERTHGSTLDCEPFVVLAGWRRQYVIGELKRLCIPYTYVELPTQDVVNELYQTLDVYPVTARYEGGPQSLIECGLLNVPVVSRNVGMASQVLLERALNDDVSLAIPTVPNVKGLTLPDGYVEYRKMFEELT